MKTLNIILSITLLLIIISCSKDNDKNPLEPATDEFEFKWLSTDGNRVVDSDGNPVVLRGINRSGLEYNKTGNRMSQAEFEYIINNWRAKIIRLPFNQEWIMTDEAYNQRLDEVIGWIKNNGAYVILDLQWKNSTEKIPRIPDIQAVEMWNKLATRYKDDPAILYDIHNEAHDVSFEEWRSRAIEIIEGIRSVHPNSLILVSGLDWAKDIGVWARNPLSYQNIVYSLHIYPWFSNANQLDALIGDYSDQVPIFVGEFGGYGENINWGKQLIGYLDEKKLGWTAWSWVDDPYLTQQADRQTPTEFGNLVRELLIRYAFPGQYMNEIYDIKVEYITTNRATINWKTSQDSDSKVVYGLTSSYTDTVYAPVLLKSHTMKMTELQPATTYHFKVISVDDFGFKVESSDSSFSTF